MRRILVFTLLALTTFGGVALSDSPRHRGYRDRGGVSVQRYSSKRHVQRVQPRSHARPRYTSRYTRPSSRTYVRPSSRTYVRPSYRSNVRPSYRSSYVVRRPIYVQRPVITQRYFNYYQRPAIVVENYPPVSGYVWVPGQWVWNGYEWIWNPGHYEPDPAYDTYNYAPAPVGAPYTY